MAAMDSSSSPMACDTVAPLSVLEVEEASSVGDDNLLLDTPCWPGGDPTICSCGRPECEHEEDLEAQLNELQDTVSRLGLDGSTSGPALGAQTVPVLPVEGGPHPSHGHWHGVETSSEDHYMGDTQSWCHEGPPKKLVFVDDFCWLLGTETATQDTAQLLLLLAALGCPLSWHKTVLSEINTWLGFQVNPCGPLVGFAPGKEDRPWSSAPTDHCQEHWESWATSAWPLSCPFLQPF